jgi:hypothetical protein
MPVLTSKGLLDMRAAVSYGPAGSGTFRLSVYVLCGNPRAGSRGGKRDNNMDILVERYVVPNTMPQCEQQQKMEFALHIWATRLENDFELRLPVETRDTPKMYKLKKENQHGIP